MIKIDHAVNGEELCISLCGRVDAANAPEVESAVNTLRGAHAGLHTVLDAEGLEYISSAGLRIILRLRKEDAALRIINVSTEVYEILDMTGFTDMVQVEKGYRRMEVEGCEVIGRGANGTVYRYDAETILKTYHDADALEEMKFSREMSRKALVKGLPTAIPYDIVRVGDSFGAVYELLNATSITKLIIAEPQNLEKHVRTYVELMKLIHATPVKEGEVPNIKDVVLDWADYLKDHLPAEKWQKLHDLVQSVPECLFLVHGDYHTNNVMVQNGEPQLIDMDTLAYGHPVFELASVFNAFVGFSAVDREQSMKFFKLPLETTEKMWELTLRMYLDTEDGERLRQVSQKAELVGYTRILRRSLRREAHTEIGQQLIAFCHARVCELLESVDTLDF